MMLKFIRIKADKYLYGKYRQTKDKVQYIYSYMPTLANTKLLKSIETESFICPTEHTSSAQLNSFFKL